MPRKRPYPRVRLLAWVISGTLLAGLAHAQTTNVELLGMLGGRVIGGAKACGITAERVRKASAKVLELVKSKAESEAERRAATGFFDSYQAAGGDEVRAAKNRCSWVHVEFSEIEVKLEKFPPGDSLASGIAPRPVPPLGQLRLPAGAATGRP